MTEDGRTRYNKISKLLEPIVGKEISLLKLRHRIMIDIGSSPNIITDTINLMLELDLIKECTNINRPMIIKYEILRNKAEI